MDKQEKTYICSQVTPAIKELRDFWESVIELGENTGIKINCDTLHKAILRLELLKDGDGGYIITRE